jgi:radical SAM superfamily enzyme YgiQ (UPF0313 family)
MRVLVLNPPFLPGFSRPQRSPAVTRSGALYYPIWLASCTGVLERAGAQVTLVDAPAAGWDHGKTLARARDFEPELIVMDTSTPSIANDLAVATLLKAALPWTFVLLVGTHASALAETALADCPGADAVAVGEYELTVLEVMEALAAGGQAERLARIGGLVFRMGETLRRTPDRRFIEDLDDLPWVSPVYRRHLPITHYFNPNAPHPMVTLMGSRGCPHGCSFCLYPQTMTGRRFRVRSVGDLLDEVEDVLVTLPGVRSIFFEDDTLAADAARCRALCEGILDRGLHFAWAANGRADLGFDMLTLMRRAGCRMVCVGFESAGDEALRAVGKGLAEGEAARFMDDARRAGVLVHGCWIFGLPGDTREGIQRTIELAVALDTDTAQFYPAIPYPGTAMYEEYRAKGWLVSEDYARWLTPEGQHACVVRTDSLEPGDIDALCRRARRRFYLRPRFLARRVLRCLTDGVELRRTLLAGRTFARHLITGA